ncbi:MAG: rod shape-determining protein RodA [Paludibacteraceae bacterium]|nr:rod shape-determining protein RodA [Paludibacteraceae bacterium]
MDRRNENIIDNIDLWTLGLYFALVVFGWISIYGASYNFDDSDFWDFSQRFGKQLVWIGCALVIGAVLLMLDMKTYATLSYVIYGFFILLLIITLLVAPDTRGSHSWLVLGPISLQPAEFAKTATCLCLARYMGSFGFSMKDLQQSIIMNLIILLPMGIIILQNETGSALAYLALYLTLYRQGMTGIVLVLGLCAAVYFVVGIKFGATPVLDFVPGDSLGMFVIMIIAVIIALAMVYFYHRDSSLIKTVSISGVSVFAVGILLISLLDVKIKFTYLALAIVVFLFAFLIVRAIVYRKIGYFAISLFLVGSIGFGHISDYAFNKILQPHQQTRIKVTLGMENDLKKSGYNVNQSMIAIGSGRWTGKGFLQGTQTKLKYVPEQDTDFIFCTVGEEHGFIGTTAVVVGFLVLMLRLISLAERQRSTFSRIYGYCVASIIFFHVAINIGMVIGLTPVIGIPLPFFSYGGSSLWSFTILLFIFLRLDASRKEYVM